MKRFSYFMLATLACLLAACNQDVQLSTEESASSESTTHFEQSLNEVFALMKEVYPSQYQKLVQRKDSYVPEFLTSANLHQCEQAGTYFRKVASNGNDEIQIDTLVYIVNFGNEDGFAVMSANEDLLGNVILALTDSGSISIEDFNYEENTNDSPAKTAGRILASTITDLTVLKFKNDLLNPADGIIIEDYTYKYSPWNTLGFIKPMVPIKIHQHAPYNRYCFDILKKQAVTGCVANALVGIMAAKKYPTQIGVYGANWTSIIARYKIPGSYEQDLLAHIIAEVGKQCHMNYGVSASGATDANAKRCLASYPNFTNVKMHEGTLEIAQEMLIKSNPMYISGSNHAWILDGWKLQERTYECYKDSTLLRQGTETRRLVHCVLGWGGVADGYYYFSRFNVKAGPVDREASEEQYSSSANVENLNEDIQIMTYSFNN